MKIQVKCSCGKVLYVPDEYGGKRGRCPQCARMINIPKIETQQPAEASPPTKICPTCGAYLSLESEICVSCQTNLKTGQWDMVEQQSRSQTLGMKKISKLALIGGWLVALLFLFCGVGIWLADLFFQEDWEAKLNDIAKMPQSNTKEVKAKLKKIEQLRQKVPRYIAQTDDLFYELKIQIRPYLDWEAIFKIAEQENNILVKCWYWQLLKNYADNTNQETKAQQNLVISQQQLQKFLQEQQGEIRQLYNEKRWREVLTRVTPKILHMMEESIQTTPELSQTWDELRKIYQSNRAEQNNQTPPPIPTLDNEKLKQYIKQFPDLVIRFEKLMQQREYQSAQQLLENFWQELQQIDGIKSDDPLLIRVRSHLREVQSVKALLSIANEGAKSNIGLSKIVFFQNGRILHGRIIQYIGSQFYLQDEAGNIIKIPLREIQAEEIVFFALNSQKTYHVHEYAGIFYLYEKKFSLAQQCLINALKAGADPQEIQLYLKKVQEAVLQNRNP